jgi:hypothetical protein
MAGSEGGHVTAVPVLQADRNTGRILRAWWVAPAVLFTVGASCNPPKLKAVLPDTGYPRQVLAIDGTTQFASVVWDVGLGSEKEMYNGLFGTSYFQIPEKVKPGLHPVAIRNSLGTSTVRKVMVLPSRGQFPRPRIEDFGLLFLAGSGPVDVVLTTAAANIDLNATVSAEEIVGGVPTPRTVTKTVSWGALPVDYLQHHKPDTFGFPVYHYAQLLSVIKGVGLGSTLRVTVTNSDKQSGTRDFDMPKSVAKLDSDGDGLRDTWEDGSYTAPSGNTLPLKAIGTDKWRKDILVEVDWMAAAVPHPSIWRRITTAFSSAPVLNPDGSRGVHIIIDRGQGGVLSQGGQILADVDCLTMGAPPPGGAPGCTSIDNFFNYKKLPNFKPDRLNIFHYAILGKKGWDTKRGKDESGEGERFGNDFFVTLANVPIGNDPGVQTGHFVHELGHNLGFTHGDLMSDDQNFAYKPNLPSVMNYNYTDFGVDVDCDMVPDGLYTYSQGTLDSLNEPFVDEMIGICEQVPLDINFANGVRGDGQYTAGALDLTGNADTLERLDDFDQWGHMLLDFVNGANSGWQSN